MTEDRERPSQNRQIDRPICPGLNPILKFYFILLRYSAGQKNLTIVLHLQNHPCTIRQPIVLATIFKLVLHFWHCFGMKGVDIEWMLSSVVPVGLEARIWWSVACIFESIVTFHQIASHNCSHCDSDTDYLEFRFVFVLNYKSSVAMNESTLPRPICAHECVFRNELPVTREKFVFFSAPVLPFLMMMNCDGATARELLVLQTWHSFGCHSSMWDHFWRQLFAT